MVILVTGRWGRLWGTAPGERGRGHHCPFHHLDGTAQSILKALTYCLMELSPVIEMSSFSALSNTIAIRPGVAKST